MNIFVTSPDPKASAQALDDKRVIKMILESAQMMATAINVLGGQSPYKTTHVNHPCSIWVRSSQGNYDWLYRHYQDLCAEYTLRFGKTHKCSSYDSFWVAGRDLVPEGKLTTFANCTEFKDLEVIEAYRLQMNKKWANDKKAPKWTKALVPVWKT